ncbi:DUF895 domain-containing protein, variant [Blastomyces dermatitidis ATCC 18188]|uniref:DUF895 domain-containing protein n=1 Tax=Ajellomyces dermatitidis (strain ATCC 18188 / CBS 674.68) TaxID=653446 RepID=F2T5X8_AJEDA|nr:DUF895 domain-containing protein [Blastomyces dermatitidis ATCC 18188]EQL35393.1 hypothetical protein BDFG_02889 [Blastomyces dermatitidis ATCC 26199]EQL35394.1 hypothetical protein, variant 1 [Blastomyces dermatitidis ATCC 26199]KMW66775.1 DUF895 domain-containing protein, variant [Blastomyces dermatitidis ATCC 18188]
MSSHGEKNSDPNIEKPVDEEAIHEQSRAVSGKPWMYKRPKIGSFKFPYYASPTSQLLLVSFVCFLCPGMFNALNGLGGGGQQDPHAVNIGNTALYSTFAVIGFTAGSIANRVGLRWTLLFGGFGYFLYVGSMLSYNHNRNLGFLTFAGALLGACAGCLWCAQGAVMMSYPDEKSKGKFISWFWIIFNLGGVIGGLVPLAQTMNAPEGRAVGDGTYIAFMILMFIGFVLCFFLVESKYVRREDGSQVIVMKNPSWWSEIKGLGEVLVSDWYIVALFPMFIASNWFYAYHFNNVNGAKFNIRTRALNSCLYYLAQMFGAFAFGYMLDTPSLRRTTRARLGLVVLFVFTMAVWGGGYAWQREYTRADTGLEDFRIIDFKDSDYVGGMFMYILYGVYDAAYQTCVYWFMGALSNNSRKLANFAGFYKGLQSAGGAATWQIDDNKVEFMTIFAINWGLLCGSIIVALPVILYKIKDTVDLEEDLKFSDETLEEVAPTALLENRGMSTGADVK